MSVTTRIAAAATACALAGLLSACGGNDNAPPPASTTTASAPAPGSGATATTATTAPPKSGTSSAPTTTGPARTPAPGTTFGGEGMSAQAAAELQTSVDQGHQPWRTDPSMVAGTFVLSRFGWQHPGVELADPHTAEVTDSASGRIVSLQLRQPAREGQGGIWVVDSGVWVK